MNPDLKSPEKALERWQDLRIGLSVQWGPSALGGKEIGWSRGTSIPAKKYDQFYKRFNPNKFDAEVRMCPRQPIYETGQVTNEQTNGYY